MYGTLHPSDEEIKKNRSGNVSCFMLKNGDQHKPFWSKIKKKMIEKIPVMFKATKEKSETASKIVKTTLQVAFKELSLL